MNKPERMEHGTRAIALLDLRSRRVRAILAIGALALYAVAFSPLYYLTGPAAAVLAIPPVAAVGWLLGMRAGLLAGLLVFPLHILLLSLVGEAGWDLMTPEALPVSLVVVAMGAIVGGLRDLNEGMRQELTGRKLAEEKLRQEMEFSNMVIQASPAFFVAIGSDGKTIMMNDDMLDTLGYTMDEVVGRDYLKTFVPEGDHTMLSRVFEKLTKSNEPTINENRVLTRDGRELLVEWHGRPVFKENGEFDFFFGLGIDITERKRAEEELRESEEKYRTLVRELNVGVFRRTPQLEGGFLEVNPALVRIHGYESEEAFLKSTPWDLYQNPQDRREFYEELMREGFVEGKELRLKKMDGTPIWASLTVSLILDKKGEPRYYQGVVEDITERKRAERRIERLNLVLRAIRNVNQLITREKDRNTLLKGICETLIETRGYHHAGITILDESGGLVPAAEASSGKHFLPLIEHLRRGELSICARKALGQPDVVVTEKHRSTCADCPFFGEEHPEGTTITTRLEHDGKVYGLVDVFAPKGLEVDEEERTLLEEIAGDIALALHAIGLDEEYRQAQKRLRESEEKHRTILENIEEGYYEVDIAGNFTFFNDSLCRILGHPADAVLGMNNRQYTDEESARKLYQAFNTVYRTGETAKAFDWAVIKKDGTKRFVEASVSLISDPAGQPTGFRGIVRDVTEHKRMQREIEEQREYLASVLRHIPDPIVTADASSRVVEWNPGAEQLFGYSRDEVQGKDTDDLITRPDVEEEARFFTKQTLAGEGIPPTEVVRYRKDGTPVSVIVASSPIMIEGELQGAVAVYTDITERKRVEKDLQQAHDTLEMRVQERTADLARTNEALQTEITERKQAEEKLRQAAKEWQATFDSITDFISIHDKHYNLVRVNSASADALKTKPEQLIGILLTPEPRRANISLAGQRR